MRVHGRRHRSRKVTIWQMGLRHAVRSVPVPSAAVASLVIALASLVPTPPSTAAFTSAATSTYVLYVGRGVAVVATLNERTDCGEVFLTSDFVNWRNVTPPLASATAPLCTFIWTGASFSSPEDGWLVARNGGSSQTILRRTRNGGRTWTTQPGGDAGSNAGYESIDFVNANVGFRQQYGTGSNGAYALQRTLDGGVTWSTRSPDPRGWCATSSDTFSSASVGFATNPWRADAANPTRLWRTVDGGVTWSPLSIPPPPSLGRTAVGLYATPSFNGRYGVVPVDYPVAGHQSLYLDATGDGGRTWQLVRAGVLPIDVPATLTVDRRAPSCTTDSPVVAGREAIISPAGPSTWWVLAPGPRGSTRRTVVNARTDGSTTYVMTGLPATTGQPVLEALNANDAVVTLPIPYGYRTTFATANGGVTWRSLHLPVSTRATPTCASAHLRITVARRGVALGHAGLGFVVRNNGSRTCLLDGYPTVQLVGTSGPSATVVTFGPDYTVPNLAPKAVELSPGETAGFLLGYADATGYGAATCPRSTALRVTPPGDLAPITVRVGMQVFGGPTITQLRCGELAVSPIVPTSTAGL